MPLKIYMIRNGEYHLHVVGLWLNLDQMLNWIGDQVHSWDARTGETDLDVFMKKHRVEVYPADGGPGEPIDWKEIIPQE
jgi:hypothetical protein